MKKTKLITILLIGLIILTTKVYAANDSYETTLDVNTNEVKSGQTVIITIGLDKISIESGEKGIGAYSGKLQYDTSILEYIKTEGTQNWEAPMFQNGLIVGNTKDGNCVNTTQNIGTITFKVKENSKIGETTITLDNFLGSMIEGDVLASNKPEVKINIISDEQNNNDNNGQTNEENNNTQNNQENNNQTNEEQNNNENTNKNNIVINTNTSNENNKNDETKNKITGLDNSTKDSSTASGNIPQTGNENSFIYACIIMLVCVAIVSFIQYVKINKKY